MKGSTFVQTGMFLVIRTTIELLRPDLRRFYVVVE